jgi:hypothetical protein
MVVLREDEKYTLSRTGEVIYFWLGIYIGVMNEINCCEMIKDWVLLMRWRFELMI